MERREFLKGFAFLSITPFLPNIEINPGSIESTSINWNLSTANPFDDIKEAMKRVRTATGAYPNAIAISTKTAESYGFDVDSVPDEIKYVKLV